MWYGVNISAEDLQRNSDEPQPAETKEDAEARNDFRSIEGDFIHRHVEPPSSSSPCADRRIIPNTTEVT